MVCPPHLTAFGTPTWQAVIRAIKRVLPEQRWRSQSGSVDTRAVCDAIEASFKGDGAVAPKEVAAKLEVIFSMQVRDPPISPQISPDLPIAELPWPP